MQSSAVRAEAVPSAAKNEETAKMAETKGMGVSWADMDSDEELDIPPPEEPQKAVEETSPQTSGSYAEALKKNSPPKPTKETPSETSVPPPSKQTQANEEVVSITESSKTEEDAVTSETSIPQGVSGSQVDPSKTWAEKIRGPQQTEEKPKPVAQVQEIKNDSPGANKASDVAVSKAPTAEKVQPGKSWASAVKGTEDKQEEMECAAADKDTAEVATVATVTEDSRVDQPSKEKKKRRGKKGGWSQVRKEEKQQKENKEEETKPETKAKAGTGKGKRRAPAKTKNKEAKEPSSAQEKTPKPTVCTQSQPVKVNVGKVSTGASWAAKAAKVQEPAKEPAKLVSELVAEPTEPPKTEPKPATPEKPTATPEKPKEKKRVALGLGGRMFGAIAGAFGFKKTDPVAKAQEEAKPKPEEPQPPQDDKQWPGLPSDAEAKPAPAQEPVLGKWAETVRGGESEGPSLFEKAKKNAKTSKAKKSPAKPRQGKKARSPTRERETRTKLEFATEPAGPIVSKEPTAAMWMGSLKVKNNNEKWLMELFQEHKIQSVCEIGEGFAICQFPASQVAAVTEAFHGTKVDGKKMTVRNSKKFVAVQTLEGAYTLKEEEPAETQA